MKSKMLPAIAQVAPILLALRDAILFVSRYRAALSRCNRAKGGPCAPLLPVDPGVLDHLAPKGDLLFEARLELRGRGGLGLRPEIGEYCLDVSLSPGRDGLRGAPVDELL